MSGVREVAQHLDLWFTLLSEPVVMSVIHQSDNNYDLKKWTVAKQLLFFSCCSHLSDCGIVLAGTKLVLICS